MSESEWINVMNTSITTVCNNFWRNEIGRNHKTLIGGVHIK